MAHRKHLIQDVHVEPEKKQTKQSKKAASQQTIHQKKEPNKKQQPSQVDYANPHIKDEHGEY